MREHFAALPRPGMRPNHAHLARFRHSPVVAAEKRLFRLLFGGSTRFKQSCFAVAIPSNYKAINPGDSTAV
jgi:hypothetical protein